MSARRSYLGRALMSTSVYPLVAVVAGGLAFAVLVWLYMLACSVGLAGGN